MAVQVAIDAIRLHGSAGIRKDYPVERILRDSLGSFYAGMSSDVLRDLLVAPLLDVDPFAKPSLEWLDSLGLRAELSG
jgi:alkylation response protein AidB-like acyl-CoA dehydrogenase